MPTSSKVVSKFFVMQGILDIGYRIVTHTAEAQVIDTAVYIMLLIAKQ